MEGGWHGAGASELLFLLFVFCFRRIVQNLSFEVGWWVHSEFLDSTRFIGSFSVVDPPVGFTGSWFTELF